jgi:hypothetical protein
LLTDVPASRDLVDDVGDLLKALTQLGLEPVLVGGMALVVLGSRRVTRDFDFVVAAPGQNLRRLVGAMYDRGLELAARLDHVGDVTATIDNRRVAVARLALDKPPSAFFLNHDTGLRVDLLFDFPVPASTLVARSRRIRIRSHVFRVASVEDLLHLKEVASRRRSVPGDADDIAFLRHRLKEKARR